MLPLEFQSVIVTHCRQGEHNTKVKYKISKRGRTVQRSQPGQSNQHKRNIKSIRNKLTKSENTIWHKTGVTPFAKKA